MTLGVIIKCGNKNQVNLSFYDIVQCQTNSFGTAFYCINVITSEHVTFYLEKNIIELHDKIYGRHFATISQWFSLNDDLITEKYKNLINEI